jgi:hypothetical protein
VQCPPQLAKLTLCVDAEELANGAVRPLRVLLDLEQYQLGAGALRPLAVWVGAVEGVDRHVERPE